MVDGVSRATPSFPMPPPPSLDCPDCADRGEVSLFRSWRDPTVSVEVARVLKGLKGPSPAASVRELKNMPQSGGTVLGPIYDHVPLFLTAKFIEAEDKRYLCIVLNYHSPLNTEASVLLLLPQGRILDTVRLFSISGLEVSGELLDKPAPDGAWVLIRGIPKPGDVAPTAASFRLDHSGRAPGTGMLDVRETDGWDGVFRLGIQGDRLEFLSPSTR